MTTTKLGRQILGHRCTYSCDCDCEVVTVKAPHEAIEAGIEFIDALPTEPLDSSHCPRHVNSGSPSTFAAVMVVVAAGGLLAMGVAVVILNWMGVL